MTQIPEPGKTYNISRLTEATGLSRRTIHFYVQSEMIPPPEGSGRYAVYTETHRLRLLAIQALKASTHLRLRGIREILDRMDLDELRLLVGKQMGQAGADDAGHPAPAPAPSEDALPQMRMSDAAQPLKSNLDDFMAEARELNSLSEGDIESPRTLAERGATPSDAEDVGDVGHAENVGDSPGDQPATLTPRGIRRFFSRSGEDNDRIDPSPHVPEFYSSLDTWHRIKITDDLEIHFRPVGDSHSLRNLTRLVESARKLFKK